jgi:hypothetical protein
VSVVHINLVSAENRADLSQDGGPCHLYAVDFQNRIYVVGVDVVLFDDTSELGKERPKPADIGAIRSDLRMVR